MNVKTVLLLMIFSTIYFAGNTQKFEQHQEVSEDLQIVQKKGKYGLWNSSKNKFEIKAKYLFAHYWETAHLIYFFDKKGKIHLVHAQHTDQMLSFENEVEIYSSSSQELIEINGALFNERLEIVHQKFEYKDYVSSYVISTKNEVMFYKESLNLFYDESLDVEEVVHSRISGYYSFVEDHWNLELSEGSLEQLDADGQLYFITNDSLNAVYKQSGDDFTQLTKYLSLDDYEFPEKSVEEILQHYYETKKIIHLPLGGFMFQSADQKWGFGRMSRSRYLLKEPIYDFAFYDVFSNKYTVLQNDVLETHEIYYDYKIDQSKDTLVSKSHFAFAEKYDIYEEMGFISFDSDDLIFFGRIDITSIPLYVFYNREDQLIYYGAQGYLYEFIYQPEMMEIWNNEGESEMVQEDHYYSGIYDVEKAEIVNHAPYAAIYFNKDGYLTLDPYYISHLDETDLISGASGLHYNITLRDQSMEVIDSNLTSLDMMSPVLEYDSLIPPHKSSNINSYQGKVYKNNKMALYNSQIPLLRSPFADIVVEVSNFFSDILIINNDSIYWGEQFLTDVNPASNIKLTTYYTDQAGLDEGIYKSVIKDQDSSFFQMDTAKVFPDGYQFEPGELVASELLEIKNGFYLFHFSYPELENRYINEEFVSVEVEENSSYVYYKKEDVFHSIDELYHDLHIYDNLLIAYKGKNAYEDTSSLLYSDGWGYDLYDVIFESAYYDVYNLKGEKIHTKRFKKYEVLENGYVLYDDQSNCALMSSSGKILTDFEYDEITFDQEKQQFKCVEFGGDVYNEFFEVIDHKEGREDFISIE